MKELLVAATVLLLATSACRKTPAPGAAGEGEGEETTRSVTVWTEKTELFMEYPALVAGEPVTFAPHVTLLATFKPLTAGTVTVEVKQQDGRTVIGEAKAPARPGLFRPSLTPQRAGTCTLRVLVRAGAFVDEIDAGPCAIHPSKEAAKAASGEGDGASASRFPFLKEQQWATEFASGPVVERELQPTVRVNGEIHPVPAREARLSSATAGRVQLASPTPVLGMPVRKGQILATITPPVGGGADRASLEAEVEVARATLVAAEAQLGRAERLFADQSVPQKSLDEARADAAMARARLSAAKGRLAQQTSTARGLGGAGAGAFHIRSPLEGTLVSVHVASGEVVEEGAPLFVVMDLEKIWLHGHVFEPDIPRVEEARAGWFTLEGYAAPFRFDERNARMVALGRVLDEQNRTVPLVFELENKEGRLRVGQFAKIEVATGSPTRVLAVPEAAVVEEAGKPVVFVQVEGESFERRPIVVELRSGGWVGLKQGLRAGERVVTKGAYDVRLANAAGTVPAHGHAH